MSEHTKAIDAASTPINWSLAPIEFHQAFRCPRCGGTSFRYMRSEPNGDGTNTRKTICNDCEYVFKLVVE